MVKSVENDRVVLECLMCPNKWVSPTRSFMPGSSIQNSHPKKFNKVVDNDNDDDTWSEEDKARIQEENGFSDEDMANGAWIDF